MKPVARLLGTTVICSLALGPALTKTARAKDPMTSGFYGALQGAVVNQKYDSTSDGGRLSKDSDTAGSVGGLGGYQHFFDSGAYVAAEGGVFFDFSEDTPLVDNPGLLADDIHYRTDYGASFYLRPGYRVTKDSVLYGLIGGEYLKVKIDEREGSADHFSSDKGIWGLGLGVGVQMAVSNSTSVRLEYRHVDYENMDYTSLITTPTSRHVEPTRDVFAISAMFHF